MENNERIAMHEDVATLKANVKTIMTNDLPHIRIEIREVKNKLGKGVYLLITNLIAMILVLIKLFVL